MTRDRVDNDDFVARLREPTRVRAGSTTHVEDAEGAGREHAVDDFLGANQFERSETGCDALRLVVEMLVVIEDFRRHSRLTHH